MTTDRHTQRAALLDRLRGCFSGDPTPDTLPGGRLEKVREWHGRRLDQQLRGPRHGVARSAYHLLDIVMGDTCRATCLFDAEYPVLQHRLFGGSTAPLAKRDPETGARPEPPPKAPVAPDDLAPYPPAAERLWVHGAPMSWEDPASMATPAAAVAFVMVIDEPVLWAEPWVNQRIAFVLDGMDDLFAGLANRTRAFHVGDLPERLTAVARCLWATTSHISDYLNTWVVETAGKLRSKFAGNQVYK